MKNISQKFGSTLVALGFLGFLAAVIISFTRLADYDQGALPAASFLCIMVGFAFIFPSLLQEGNGEMSTMRIIVFAVTMVFCMLYIKLGWATASFQEFSVDSTWVYILGIAFGSKAFQKFGEGGLKSDGINATTRGGKTDAHVSGTEADASKTTIV